MKGTDVTVYTATGIEVTGTVVSYADGWIVVDTGDGLWHMNPDQVIAVEQVTVAAIVAATPAKRTSRTKAPAKPAAVAP
jgi:uncharacterized protein DUF6897